jgi:NDP-sugar pyrophosphorylase family protein
MNILLLAAGSTEFNTHDGGYPLCLTEVDGMPLIERQTNQAIEAGAKKLIVALKAEDINKFHLDSVVSLLSDKAVLVSIPGNTAGSACSALIAIEHIDNEDELLVINGNELLDIEFYDVLQNFRGKKLDAGIVCFSSLHPRYSFARVSEDGMVSEVAEKNPISKSALAGFFWFAKGSAFVNAVQSMIRKDANVNGSFYISPSLNELILDDARVGAYNIMADQYQPIKSERQFINLSAHHS